MSPIGVTAEKLIWMRTEYTIIELKLIACKKTCYILKLSFEYISHKTTGLSLCETLASVIVCLVKAAIPKRGEKRGTVFCGVGNENS